MPTQRTLLAGTTMLLLVALCACATDKREDRRYTFDNRVYVIYNTNSSGSELFAREYDNQGKPTGNTVPPEKIDRITKHGQRLWDGTRPLSFDGRAAVAEYQPRLFILDTFGDDRVVVFDGNTLSQVGDIPVPGARGMAGLPGSQNEYVVQSGTASSPAMVSVIDLEQAAVTDSFTLEPGIYPDRGEKFIAISPDEQYLYITGRHFDQSALIDVIDLRQRRIVKTLQPFTDTFATMIELSPDGQQLLAATGTSDLVVYDTLTLTSTVHTRFYGGNFLRFHPNGSRFYTMLGFTLQAWDSATLTPVDTESFPLAESLQQFDDIAIDADGYFAYVNIQQTGQVYRIDLVGKKVIEVVETGGVGLTRVLVDH